jgi:hypothetical protein
MVEGSKARGRKEKRRERERGGVKERRVFYLRGEASVEEKGEKK